MARPCHASKRAVSIPLNSGHRFNGHGMYRVLDMSLNPFEFRASIQYHQQRGARRMAVSIPLNSGHRFNPRKSWTPRASSGLNPFEFRASIQSRRVARRCHARKVSIPLNSGHRFNHRAASGAIKKAVSIPLNSGHRFNRQLHGLFRMVRSQSL